VLAIILRKKINQLKGLFAILSGFFFMNILHAQQVVNVESRRYNLRDTSMQGNVQLNLEYFKNTNTYINIGNTLDLMWKRNLNTYLLINEFNFLQSNTKNLNYNSYQHFRLKRDLNEWLCGEAFVQTQFNQQLGLNFRGLIGAGPRIRIVEKDSLKLFLGPMWMYEYENTTDDSKKNVHNRLSLYLSGTFYKTGQFGIDGVCYYQPDIINTSDYRLLSEIKLEFYFSQNLKFRFSISQNYQSNPPSQIPAQTTNIRNAFVYRF